MRPDPLELILPPLQETRHSRESLVRALREERALPEAEIAIATAYAADIAADVIAVVERAGIEELDDRSGRLFFRGLHILGGRQISEVFQPLIRFLHGPQDRVEDLLGDAVTETLSGILAGAFDGDEAALQNLVVDTNVDHFVRDAALSALVLLSFDARINRSAFEAFLLEFDTNKLIPSSDDVVWHAWMTAIAVLGMERLSPLVRVAFRDGRISPEWCDEDDFNELLDQALTCPDDRSRLTKEHIGYIDDVLEALQRFQGVADEPESEARTWADHENSGHKDSWLLPPMPHHNPFRGVGRNDACPCGSGKKAKKCCLR